MLADQEKEEKAYKIGSQVLHEKDLKFKVEIGNETFVLKYPNPFEKAQIEIDIARKLDGLPRSAYSQEHLVMVEAAAYANALVVAEESPSWFKSAWTCYDDNVVGELYSGYLSFREDLRKKLQTGGFKEGS